MSLKGAAKVLRKTNLLSNVADATGVSKSNAIVRLTNPADEVLRDTEREGNKGYVNFFKEGGMTDPAHVFHGDVQEIPDTGAPDTTNSAAAGYTARDRLRLQVYRSLGRSSTIKVGAGAAPYNGQQKQLLGA